MIYFIAIMLLFVDYSKRMFDQVWNTSQARRLNHFRVRGRIPPRHH